MDSTADGRRAPASSGPNATTGSRHVFGNLFTRFINRFENYLLIFVLGGFFAGIWVASFSQPVVDRVDSIINGFMGVYDLVAPIAIFLIVSPSLARLFATRNMGKFGLLVMLWFAARKLLAGLWAIAFILIVFRIPILPQGSLSLMDGVSQSLGSVGNMAMTSSYFWAMYLAVGVALLSIRVERLTVFLEKMMNVLEQAGGYLMPVMPIFMFGIGAYIYGLPGHVQEQLGLEGQGTSGMLDLDIWGWAISPRTSFGMISIYVLGAVLTAIACFMWQFVFILIARSLEPRFSISGYFTKYWIKVYPLLWATSSEALATPLNLFLTKKYAPWIRSDLRRFIVGVGSYMDINGTIINVFVLGAVVLLILGLNISVIELLFIIPIVFLISYGVPGIPGELVLFAGPMATMLNIPEASLPIFLAVYLGLQLGLPDSFRTGSNSTDEYVSAVLLNAVYEKHFAEDTNVVIPDAERVVGAAAS
ncbi:MAG: cation:dicarboxylase symporter family transporter [Chloroflexi bacterium]|nr:cation:dicarboxylase symporter family transporter [Chloroflexota bacterium]